MWRPLIVLALCAALWPAGPGSAAAGTPPELVAPTFTDPALQRRYEALTRELRCLVCQNQSIADSHAFLAADLRREVQRLLEQGASDAEIVEFMVARYGDFVLYRPPVSTTTWLLWFGPALLLSLGALVLVRVVRARARLADEEPGP